MMIDNSGECNSNHGSLARLLMMMAAMMLKLMK